MRIYRDNAASETRAAYGAVLVEGLRGFEETRSLADDFEGLNERLELAADARRERERLARRATARLRIREFFADRAILALAAAADAAGVGEEILPRGDRGVWPATARAKLDRFWELVQRLRRCDALASWQPKLEAELAPLAERVAEHERARRDLEAASRDELALRAEHARAIAGIIDRVKFAFPDDRARQRVVFPQADRRAVRSASR